MCGDNLKLIVVTSAFIIPVMILFIVVYGMINKTAIYDVFVDGAKDGMKTVVGIAPTLIGLMMAVGVLRASGFLDFIAEGLGVITQHIGFPSQLVPLVLVRMFSASAATGLTLDIFRQFGPDSHIGLIASIMMSCTETIFYTMSVYFIAAKVSKTRWTLAGALVATTSSVIASVILAGMMG